MDAPFIKRANLLRQRAEAHELSDVVKTEDEVESETNNELAQAQQQLQQAQQQLLVAELGKKVDVLTAQAAKAMAEVDLIRAKVVSTNAETVYSALQAGGVATSQPQIAPAGDEILRSSGWKDVTPTPTIAQLDTAPVQPAIDPANMAQGMPQNTDPMAPANPDQAQPPEPQQAPDLQPQTGHVGEHAGIETAAIE
jgi:hypothetical protein